MSDRQLAEKSLSFGKLKGYLKGTVAVDPPSIAAASCGTVAVTIAGLTTAHIVVLAIPAALEANLGYVGRYVSAANTLTIKLVNPTAAAIDGAALSWTYTAWIP